MENASAGILLSISRHAGPAESPRGDGPTHEDPALGLAGEGFANEGFAGEGLEGDRANEPGAGDLAGLEGSST